MQSKISIIIPVYNAEKYIDACLKSILEQTHKNIEIILIDDGSPDRSGQICDQYAARDSRFIVIHTENRGVGNARNAGLERMSGEYCFFLDPDDLLPYDCLSYLLLVAKSKHADVVLGKIKMFSTREPSFVSEDDPIECVYRSHSSIVERVLFDKPDMRPLEEKAIAPNVDYAFCSSLYRTALFREHNIRFLDISYGEDTYVCLKYLLFAAVAVTTNRITYWYRRNPSSATFRYHENYLEETKKYYSQYCGLFRKDAPEYFKRAELGLEGQYYRRCLSAIEREITFARQRKIPEIQRVLREISEDEIYRRYIKKNRSQIGNRHIRLISRFMKIKMYLMCAIYARLVATLHKTGECSV